MFHQLPNHTPPFRPEVRVQVRLSRRTPIVYPLQVIALFRHPIHQLMTVALVSADLVTAQPNFPKKSYIYGLDKLLAVFPGAAIIQTHRNPVEVVKSQIRLTQVLEAMFARPRESEQLAMSEARKIEQMLGYITRFREAYPNVAR